MLSPLIGRPEEGGSPGGPVGTAEEAAAGEVTDRMSSFISLWTFSSACPSRHAGVQPLWCCFFFGLFVFPAARQDLWTLWKLNKFQNFALPHFKNTKIGKSTAHTPSLRSNDRHEGACCVWTSSFKCHRPGELPVPFSFFFVNVPLPVWGAEMFPTDVLHRTVPDVSQTSPGLHRCDVGHSGGCSSFVWRAAHNQGPRSAMSMRADAELLPFFFCWVMHFCPSVPSRPALITGPIPPPTSHCSPALSGLFLTGLRPNFRPNEAIWWNLLTQISDVRESVGCC